MTTAESEKQWHESFPPTTVTAEVMPQHRLMQMLSLQGLASVLVIDVRRTDYEGGCIRGSLNIPAQGFYWNMGIL
jgi:arsenical-resistance protein 2